MTGNRCKGDRINPQEIFGASRDGLEELLRAVLQEVLEQEMTDALGADVYGHRKRDQLREFWP